MSWLPSNGQTASHLVIMLHGWGADAKDLHPLASMLDLPGCQFLFPNAPFPHPSVPGGLAWYSLDTAEYTGLEESKQQLRDWLVSLEENTGIPLENTFLCGFSQGGAMTVDVGLSLPLAGLCVLSGYLHAEPHIGTEETPDVLIVHGLQDMVVPVAVARRSRDLLRAMGVPVEYHELNMGHEIPIPVLTLLRSFLRDRVANV
ncbi:alpha/beta hydrolase [Pannus brasiliensis]|uniref:alpha/beta hydrolase n=1 Tax=Pannus brasiliensis TaxID=1579216 RepID=UPI003BEF33FB